MKQKLICLCLALALLLCGCSSKKTRIVPIESLSPSTTAAVVYTPRPSPEATPQPEVVVARIEEAGMTIGSRINPPMGYSRDFAAEGSFAAFLRTYPVKAAGADVLLHTGQAREDAQAAAVLDIALGSKNHEGPAGAVARLLAEYWFSRENFGNISFMLNKSFAFTFNKWRQGNLLNSEGGTLSWKSGGKDSNSEENFKAYLSTLFVYISIDSLRRDLQPIEDVDSDEIQVGDLFFGQTAEGKTTCVMVADICRSNETGEKLMLLVQGGFPAQTAHVVENPGSDTLSPWYPCDFVTQLKTPDATFNIEDRFRFKTLYKENIVENEPVTEE